MASSSGSSFSFELALVYTLSPASIKRVCHSSKNMKKQSSFYLKEATLFRHSGSPEEVLGATSVRPELHGEVLAVTTCHMIS